MKISKTAYLHTFTFVVILLALSRCIYDFTHDNKYASDNTDTLNVTVDSINNEITVADNTSTEPSKPTSNLPENVLTEPQKPHRILSVPSYKVAFPDSNEVQLVSAQRYGVTPVMNRDDAEHRKSELVYVGANPYFHVDKLCESIPYLVPRANNLLQDIGKAFFDSLFVKGVPLHQIIVTSVLRTEEDVQRLRKHNRNASENSCHRFGTTFDICYNRYVTVQTVQEPRRSVTNDTLKWVLAEVLRDMRQAERCYVKYEVKQGCFHLTVR